MTSRTHPVTGKIIVAALYKFVHLPDFRELRLPLLEQCRKNSIKGTFLLAEEGINGTIAGSRNEIDTVLNYLRSDARLSNIEHKESQNDHMPFYRMKVKQKKEIVTMGRPDIDPRQKSGKRASTKEWNALLVDPEVLIIDTRNQYEYEIGTFRNAISPNTSTFSDFPEYAGKKLDPDKHKKIAMFCTGGIRCEKATSYLLKQGFNEVYHLNGGILKYLEEVKPEENLWQGECFVFDGRVAVNKNLEKGTHEMCYSCRMPVSTEDRRSPEYEQGISCPRCLDTLTAEKRASLHERQYQVRLAECRQEQHIGIPVAEKKKRRWPSQSENLSV
jgi:UPF0176 protein